MPKCPYYKNGFCYSPHLDRPTDIVTFPNRCYGQYTTCRYYVERNENKKQGLQLYEETEEKINFYPDINLVDESTTSECEYYRLLKTKNGFIAQCKVIGRILTTHQAQLCSKEYNRCPFRMTVK